MASPPRSYPPVYSIPRTSAARIAEATPDVCPTEPIPSRSRVPGLDATGAATVLYLAYGANLAAETFLGRRGIRPLSQLNVSAPSLRLTFDLPGIPYREPCFANTALRKLPDKPKLPPDLPRPPPDLPVPNPVPDLPGAPPYWQQQEAAAAAAAAVVVAGLSDAVGGDAERAPAAGGGRWTNAHGDPSWPHGLIGVVYEVTPADYAHILATEGGGASYTDILVPCLALPEPRVGVPERPPAPPEIPRPFLVHTLFAPRLPVEGPGGGDGTETAATWRLAAGRRPDLPPWARRLLRPSRRPDPEYAQPSARYLTLLRDGAREHELPADYQAYLGALAAYEPAGTRQKWGLALMMLLWAPLLLLLLGTSRLLADRQGRVPLWVVVGMAVVFNLMWMSYDYLFKPLFGDGERTQGSGDGESAPLLSQKR